MNIEIKAEGDVVESQELLNGTRTIAFEAASDDNSWLVSGVVSWSRGLIDYAGEGDLTLAREDGAELYASLAEARVVEGEDNAADVSLECRYEIDGGAGPYDGASGSGTGRIVIEGDVVRGSWRMAIAGR